MTQFCKFLRLVDADNADDADDQRPTFPGPTQINGPLFLPLKLCTILATKDDHTPPLFLILGTFSIIIWALGILCPMPAMTTLPQISQDCHSPYFNSYYLGSMHSTTYACDDHPSTNWRSLPQMALISLLLFGLSAFHNQCMHKPPFHKFADIATVRTYFNYYLGSSWHSTINACNDHPSTS